MKKIIISRTDSIGDVILTLPMAEALKKCFPAAYVAMLIRRYTAELVEDNCNVDRILFYDDNRELLPFTHLTATLRAERFDAVFHTHPRFRLALMTWFARIPTRVGSGYRWYSSLFNRRVYEHRKDARFHEYEYNLHLLKAIDLDVSAENHRPTYQVLPQAADRVRKLLAESGLRPNQRFVILHPGSGGSARDWRPEHFGELGKKLSAVPDLRVLVTGGETESDLIGRVCAIAGDAVVPFVNKVNLREFAALASMANLFVANSTGPIHLAAAVGTPVIGLYPQVTPLSVHRWGPVTSNKTLFTPVGKPPDCRKCTRRSGCECMDTIPVTEVFAATLKHLRMTA